MAGRFLRSFDPLARWMISAGIPTGAPNVILTVRGRRSGKPRSVPVAMLELDGACFVQACFGETGWVANLRVAGEATVTKPGGHRVPVRAIELSPEEAAPVLQRALAPFRRSRLFRALYGPHARGPVGVMWAFRIRMDDTLEEYTAAARPSRDPFRATVLCSRRWSDRRGPVRRPGEPTRISAESRTGPTA